MAKVRCVKATKASFDALDSKDGDTLYFVSENGDFDPTSLTGDEEGDIYLGGTLLTGSAAEIALDGDTLVVGDGEAEADEPLTVTRELPYIDQTAGGQWSGKGVATIKRLQGSGCVVFNQMAAPFDATHWLAYTSNPKATVTFADGVAKATVTAPPSYVYEASIYPKGTHESNVSTHVMLYSLWAKASYNCSLYWSNGSANIATLVAGEWKAVTIRRTGSTGDGYFSTRDPYPSAGDTLELKQYMRFDLTVMFGAGNEPTADEFFDMFPDFYAQTSKTLTGSYYGGFIFSFGFNLCQEISSDHYGAELSPDIYVIEGPYTSLWFTPIRSNLADDEVTPDESGVFSVTQRGVLTINGYSDGETCVHRLGSSSGYEESWFDCVTLDDIINNIFPYGLLAIGGVRDEMVTDGDGYACTAIQRIGVRDYESTDDEDADVVTDGTHTAYVLDEAVEHQLSSPARMWYKADGWGAEFLYDGSYDKLPLRLVTEYVTVDDVVTKVVVEGERRNIEDWRIEAIDGTVTASGANPVTGAAVAAYVDGAMGDIETLLEAI
mgnify:CR=1 FL=1